VFGHNRGFYHFVHCGELAVHTGRSGEISGGKIESFDGWDFGVFGADELLRDLYYIGVCEFVGVPRIGAADNTDGGVRDGNDDFCEVLDVGCVCVDWASDNGDACGGS
jgi:hypothetical protein